MLRVASPDVARLVCQFISTMLVVSAVNHMALPDAKYSLLYTMSGKKRCHFIFVCNSAKC